MKVVILGFLMILLFCRTSLGEDSMSKIYSIDEFQPGQYGLFFSELEPYFKPIQNITGNIEFGGGYTWESMVKAIQDIRGMNLNVLYDPESDMFAAYGSNKDALLELGKIIDELSINDSLMKDALTHAKKGGFLE